MSSWVSWFDNLTVSGGCGKHVETVYRLMFFILLFFMPCCFPTHMSPSLTTPVSDQPWAKTTVGHWMADSQHCWVLGDGWRMSSLKGVTSPGPWGEKKGTSASQVEYNGCWDCDCHRICQNPHHQCNAQPNLRATPGSNQQDAEVPQGQPGPSCPGDSLCSFSLFFCIAPVFN